ncbi:GNAT family N-acetyltransferase [Nesterenkonia flava]|uniref:GNAT family N-acetyltransferase n=1 Tax=Nesterenkonia flava TaxID=469799 RepID=A0ABU1FS63_9MICC|nr:GNAT family N-acetyltransferase [Nesterenkonia flava]MDR5711496.1 GNAT family N-acetyltransferase [Nesterenkonia flava]
MLFVHEQARGQGLGTALTDYVIKHHAVSEVDVNEQNPQAVGFYLSRGFQQVGRSEMDGSDLPYPLLHLRLPEA